MPPRPRVKSAERFRVPRLRPTIPTSLFRAPLLQASFVSKATSTAAPTQELYDARPLPPNRWVSDVRARIGKCISFGCNPAQVQRAASIIGTLAREWRVLSAGSEGFLTEGRAGLEDQQVVWGEMDSFVGPPASSLHHHLPWEKFPCQNNPWGQSSLGKNTMLNYSHESRSSDRSQGGYNLTSERIRQGHVNNANYIRYAESARVNWAVHFAVEDPKHREAWKDLMRPKTIGLIMKSITAEYKFPMTAPDTISAYHRLRICPEETHTSLILDCIILSHRHRRIAARTSEDIAIYDYREAKKTVFPGFMLDVLRDTWRRQEERADWARERIWNLLKEVECLEKETWDRKDAVEDFGTASK
ncbi:thioesterase-like superfamily-domain-containing protein [Xylaria sp. FL1777]|nr:thioesterase-like superfamily-domain-containing protein [Xylaria sp. FL1777]